MTKTHHYIGLTDAQVLESRAKYGANVLTPPEEDSLWDQILEVCKHPIAIIMACLIIGTAILAGILASSMGAIIWVMPAIVTVATLLTGGSGWNLKGCDGFLLIATVITLGQIAIVQVPFLNNFFNVESLPLHDWIIIFIMGFMVTGIRELFTLFKKA